MDSLVTIPLYVLLGFTFGFLFEKSDVASPESIRGQFTFDEWTMMKMFLGAVSTSSMSFIVAQRINPEKAEIVLSKINDTKRPLSAAIVGAMIMGVGMFCSGACPGMVTVQLGAGVPNAHITIIGGLIGAFLYGVLDPYIMPLLQQSRTINGTVATYFNLKNGNMAIALSVMCGAVAIGLEQMIPIDSYTGAWYAKARWPPAVSGMLIGSLQLPLILLGKKLGNSSSYMTVVSQLLWCSTGWQQSCEYLEGKRCGLKNWWQVAFVVAAVAGSFQSASYSGSIGRDKGVSEESAFFGGILLLFGARMARGCPSGLGVSSMAALAMYAFIAVAAMFAGGILAGLIHKFYIF